MRPTKEQAIEIVATHYCGMGDEFTADIVHEVAAHALHAHNENLVAENQMLRRLLGLEPAPREPAAVVPRVVQYLYERQTLGQRRYGTPLKTHNGRSALEDALAEITDFGLYFAQYVMEVLGDLPPGDVDD